jgi:hypothetical protein
MATMTKDTTNNKWIYNVIIDDVGEKNYQFSTENKFLDADIVVKTNTTAVGNLALALTDLTSVLDMGSANSGYYWPTIALNGTITPVSAGWITNTATNVFDDSVGMGKVAQSTLKNGTTSIGSGAQITPSNEAQIINISAGYYHDARTITIQAASTSNPATIKSGEATLGSLTYAYNSTSGVFDISGTATIA